jgi:BolA protein
VTIVSQAFEGKGRIERHRIVYKVLGEELEGGVHSLSLKLLSPSELNFHEGFQN